MPAEFVDASGCSARASESEAEAAEQPPDMELDWFVTTRRVLRLVFDVGVGPMTSDGSHTLRSFAIVLVKTIT